jgi:N-acetylmuramoyl-L-alanine amidase
MGLGGLGATGLRGVLWNLVEWRARRQPDPVARLQFLRRHIGTEQARLKSKTAPRRSTASAITVAVALAGVISLRPWENLFPVNRRTPPATGKNSARAIASVSQAPATPGAVWLVEASERSDIYSNGLRVENLFSTATSPRKYFAFSRSSLPPIAGEWRTRPVGIVFHTTESHIVPFEEDQNRELRRDGEGLLAYVSRRRSYHFVIDRFGRVFRIVRESDYANHAGNSVWADDDRIYINLNQSFFGVALEAKNNPAAAEMAVNPAQIHAARILVEMLRARYAIPAENCVAHGQVSVNPSNGRAGYHIDWAANLPFADLGLGNNYQRPLPSVALFGFEPDAALTASASEWLAQGIEQAQEKLQQQAAARQLPLARYRAIVQEQYRAATERQRIGE